MLADDQRDRLTGVTGAASGNETYAYDVLDNVRRTVLGSVDRRFAFNTTTNRLSQTTMAGSTVLMDYAWNNRGELTSRTKTTPGNAGVTPPRIFQNGLEENVLVATEALGFDQARRLVSYLVNVTHQYDAHQRRVSTTVPGWGTRYQIYSRAGELLYVEDAGANERTEFFHLNGTLTAERTRPLASETATVNYLHTDHRGTPTVKTSSAGTRTYRSRLQPYGTPYDGIYRDGPGFTKHATDEISTMTYMQQRYYDPAMPGFISPDPVGASADSFSRYAYANNNPYTFTDPDGGESGAFYTQDRYKMAMPELTPTQASVALAAQAAVLLGPLAPGAAMAVMSRAPALNNAAVVVGDIAAGDAIGGASLSVPLAAGIKVTADVIANAPSDSKMLTTQRAVSMPVVENYVERLAAGSPAPPISVDGNVIVEGAHRYVAAKILGQEPSVVPGNLSPSQAPLAYPIQDIKVDPTDWGNR